MSASHLLPDLTATALLPMLTALLPHTGDAQNDAVQVVQSHREAEVRWYCTRPRIRSFQCAKGTRPAFWKEL